MPGKHKSRTAGRTPTRPAFMDNVPAAAPTTDVAAAPAAVAEVEPALFPGVHDRPWLTPKQREKAAAADAKRAAETSIDPAIVDVFYTAISGVGVAMLLRAGFSPKAAKAAQLTPDDLAALRAPTVAMLEKYVPMTAYGVEWSFALAVLGVVMVKAMAVQTMEDNERAAGAGSQPAA